MLVNRELLYWKRFYLGFGFAVKLGYCYLTKNGSKGFVPEDKIPDRKINAIQIIPGNKALVLDIDNRAGVNGHDFLPCSIPEGTPSVQTQSGSGRQYWFSGDTCLKTFADSKNRIDLLTGSTGIFAPPSKIQGGGVYHWLVPLDKDRLLNLPDEILLYCLKRQQPRAPEKQQRTYSPVMIGSKGLYDISPKQRACLEGALERCRTAQKGGRSDNDFRFIIWGLSIGLDVNTLWGLCRDVGKFKEKRLSYFRGTVKQALKKIGK